VALAASRRRARRSGFPGLRSLGWTAGGDGGHKVFREGVHYGS
jgi:hypothetical protein